jgi:hypothetical protein
MNAMTARFVAPALAAFAAVAGAIVIGLLPHAPALAQAATPSGTALVQALREGGYVVYFRHTATDFGQSDERLVPGDCTTQRNLTDAGRADARSVGEAIRTLRIPVGDVLASPYCRTLETGMQMFGRAVATPAVRGGPAAETGDRYADLRRLLSTPVPAGTNVFVTSHGNPFVAVAGPPYLAEGEAAVIAPRGADGFRVVGRLRKETWLELAGAQGPRP